MNNGESMRRRRGPFSILHPPFSIFLPLLLIFPPATHADVTVGSAAELAAALGSPGAVGPGGTVWIRPGTYKHPNRGHESRGFAVRVAGSAGAPVVIRGVPGRVRIDGGLQILGQHVWVRDLEIFVSEANRTTSQAGSTPGADIGRPHGGLDVQSGAGHRFINLVIHDNGQGISLWEGAVNTEVYGCVVYGNGWKGPDRHHGHAIYTQNRAGVKTISNCILSAPGGGSYSFHAYSVKGHLENFLVQENILYGGTFLIGGGQPSRGIRVLRNAVSGVDLRLGYGADSDDCEVRDNVLLSGRLRIEKFRRVTEEGNVSVGGEPRAVLYPNKYDSRRAHLAVFNPGSAAEVRVKAAPFLHAGETYRLYRPEDLHGAPTAEGTCGDDAFTVPMRGSFAAFVVLKGRSGDALAASRTEAEEGTPGTGDPPAGTASAGPTAASASSVAAAGPAPAGTPGAGPGQASSGASVAAKPQGATADRGPAFAKATAGKPGAGDTANTDGLSDPFVSSEPREGTTIGTVIDVREAALPVVGTLLAVRIKTTDGQEKMFCAAERDAKAYAAARKAGAGDVLQIDFKILDQLRWMKRFTTLGSVGRAAN